MPLDDTRAVNGFDRRRIISICWSVVALAALGLLLVALTPDAPVWPIYALAVMVGSARAFANPASQALLPNLVAANELCRALFNMNEFVYLD